MKRNQIEFEWYLKTRKGRRLIISAATFESARFTLFVHQFMIDLYSENRYPRNSFE